MNLKEITDLCKAGKAEEAYEESKKQLAASPEDRYARVGAAYSIKAMIEKAVSSDDDAAVLSLLGEYAALRLEEVEEAEMNNRLPWAVRMQILHWRDAGNMDMAKVNALFVAIRDIKFVKPHRYYSVLLDSFLKVSDANGEPWPAIGAFIDWFGLENLLEEDYKRVLLTNGQSMSSLAERAYLAALKSLTAAVTRGEMIAEAENFIKTLEALEESHPEYTNILYRKSHLLRAMGRTDEALAAARAFVRRRPTEYWAWTALGDVAEDEESRAACYSRALACRVDPMFQGKLRIKLAASMFNLGQYANARREFEKVLNLYIAKGWHIPPNVEAITRQQWYQMTAPAESNRDFYNRYSAIGEQYLSADMPETDILISNVNPAKQTVGYITADRKRGFFSSKRLQNLSFNVHQIYKARFEDEPGGEKAGRVISCRRVDDASAYDGIFYRQIDAELGLRPGQTFQFADDIYVDGTLMRGMQPGTRCTVTAVLYYNLKKSAWGWRAVRVREL